MLTFTDSKLRDIQYRYIYIAEDLEFIIHVFYWNSCILDHKIYTKCKKTSHLLKFICKRNIYSRIKSPQQKNLIFHSVPKTFDFSQNSSVPFHQVTFHHSISSLPLIDKPNQSSKTPKKWKKCLIHYKKQYYTSKDKCLNLTKFFKRQF